MNRLSGWMAVFTLLLAACTVPELSALGPFACEDSSSCAEGYTCAAGRCVLPGEVPDIQPGESDGGGTQPGESDGGGTQPGGNDGGSTEPADTTPPTLEVLVPSIPAVPPSVGGTSYTEVGSDGKPLSPAFRRDQEIMLELRSDSSLPISLFVKGSDDSPVVMTVVPFTEGCAVRQCARAAVPLWKPRLDALRGSLPFEATVRDEAGNIATRTGSLPVTRWKWAYTAFPSSESDNSIDGTPGLGEKGTVYVTTWNTELTALTPEGRAVWSTPQSGEGTPVVGKGEGGRELVYARGFWEDGTGQAGHLLHVYDVAAASPVRLATCPETPVNQLFFDSYALAGAGSAGESVVTVAHVATEGAFLALRGATSGSGAQCQALATTALSSERGNVLVRGGALYYSDANSFATSIQLGTATPRTGWPISSDDGEGINGMAVSGSLLIMGEGEDDSTSDGGISVTPIDSPRSASLRYSGGSVAAPVVGVGGVAFGVERRAGRLVRATTSGFVRSTDTGFTYRLAPTLGQGGLVYAMRGFELGVLSSSDLASRWKWRPNFVPSGAKAQSPTLDCTRDDQGTPVAGRPGVLYAPIHNRVYALVVDSAGLDADAPWPKGQHDGRNSGTPDVPVLRCP